MRNRLWFCVPLVLCLVAFSTNVYSQAVLPDESTLTPVINPPNPQTNIVISLATYLTSGVSVFDAMNQALLACRQQHAAKLVISTGTYVFDDPKVRQFNYYVVLVNQSDLIAAAFNGAGSGDAGRASPLRSVCESKSVSAKLFNEAFLLMQYFGYLQRNPYVLPEPTLDYQGYNFWLAKLNQFSGYLAAEMVNASIASTDSRQRFGP